MRLNFVLNKSLVYNRKKLFIFIVAILLMVVILIGRLGYIMIFQSEHYSELATQLHVRERQRTAGRG